MKLLAALISVFIILVGHSIEAKPYVSGVSKIALSSKAYASWDAVSISVFNTPNDAQKCPSFPQLHSLVVSCDKSGALGASSCLASHERIAINIGNMHGHISRYSVSSQNWNYFSLYNNMACGGLSYIDDVKCYNSALSFWKSRNSYLSDYNLWPMAGYILFPAFIDQVERISGQDNSPNCQAQGEQGNGISEGLVGQPREKLTPAAIETVGLYFRCAGVLLLALGYICYESAFLTKRRLRRLAYVCCGLGVIALYYGFQLWGVAMSMLNQ